MRSSPRLGAAVCAAVVLAVGCGSGDDSPEGGVVVVDAWTRPTPPGVDSAAFYVTVENRSSEPTRYLGATSSACTVIVPHLSVFDDNDVASMDEAPADALDLGVGDRIEMEPNGLHLMCLGLTDALEVGDEVVVDLDLDGVATVEATLSVEQR